MRVGHSPLYIIMNFDGAKCYQGSLSKILFWGAHTICTQPTLTSTKKM